MTNFDMEAHLKIPDHQITERIALTEERLHQRNISHLDLYR